MGSNESQLTHCGMVRKVGIIIIKKKKQVIRAPMLLLQAEVGSEPVRQVQGSVVGPPTAPPRFFSKSSSRVGVLNIVFRAR